jgi:Fe2+ transport system protein FeoA
VEPYDGPLGLALDDQEVIIGRAAAAEIRVTVQ